MKKLITLACLFFIAVSGIAQANDVDYSKNEFFRKMLTGKANASLFMGTGIGFLNSKPALSCITTYIAPVVNYQLTQKFKLNFAFIHTSFNGNMFMNNRFVEQPLISNTHYSGNSMLFGGQYLLNVKTMVSGTVLYGSSPEQDRYKGAMLGIDYKVTSHSTLSVKATFIQGKGYNYFGSNQLAPAGMQPSLFNTSPVNF